MAAGPQQDAYHSVFCCTDFFLPGNDVSEILPQGEAKAGGEPETHLPSPDTHRRSTEKSSTR